MRRFLSVWLPRWSIERRHKTDKQQPQNTQSLNERNKHDAPFVLIAHERIVRVTATNLTAEQAGISVGLSLTDARALYPDILTEDASPDQDLKALENLTLWCQRYSPLVTSHAPDGFALDITGCAHLFGGERAMLHEIQGKLTEFQLTSHLALASSLGAAWAAARYGNAPLTLVKAGDNKSFLSPLPLSSLRLDPAIVLRLNQLGLRKIGHLLNAPEAPLTARFGPSVMQCLHRATGDAAEIFNPLFPPAPYHVKHPFDEPVLHHQALEAALVVLSNQMEVTLKAANKGTRKLHVQIFRVDGHVEHLSIGTSRLCQQADHLTLLFQESLSRLHDDLDTGYGIDLMTMAAFDVEVMDDEQNILPVPRINFESPPPANSTQGLDKLLDRFGNRFGFDKVTRPIPTESYIPENAVRSIPVFTKKNHPDWQSRKPSPPRPFLLFSPPELITVLAQVPDGPPLRFQWRRQQHHITRAEGPERLAPEWWAVKNDQKSVQTRDYYRVEDTTGHRFWLYRDGLYNREQDIPRWYVQGLFP
ncbi:MAG: DNA polymerase Y family protein [Sneathiella sp.]